MDSARSRRIVAALLAGFFSLSVGGCSLLYRLHPPALHGGCSGPLMPSQSIPGDVFFRDQVRLRAGAVDQGLTLVSRKRDGALVVVALSNFGSKLFAITQEGVETEVEIFPGPRLPAPPLNFLYDLHRVRFFAAETPPGTNGLVEYVSYGTVITELWQGGLLSRRTFPAVDGRSAVTVRFDTTESEDGEAPARTAATDSAAIEELGNLLSEQSSRRPALVVNEACGYTLRIVNVNDGQSG